ncbi:S-formylglutathione hydrolase FrmB [Amycolatopsis pretoriensis]|uniref:Acyl-CoA:diacylglycerol acyltransferase n=2 Tax=Amycolatopsis pretoriensis TaxID=218821 RepID=A0A1H5R2J2_9PSEU|nr:alpha/beta hydrolase-fold protein [Amycolatopsis pretoriensis]SEF32555.1 S-formylglutathione hydrolase FrmB [Amycolatopsis pretoriensis]
MLSRRGLLAGSTLALLAGCSSAEPAPGPPPVPAPTRPSAPSAPVTVQRMPSAARGTDVDLVLITPEGVPSSGLPVCLALHGRGARARTFLDLGVPAALTRAVREGVPPFAVAAVDGDHYWVGVGEDDDPQRMLTDEVPAWLTARDLRPASAVFGISMGGFGALRFARAHPDLKAVATASAALFVSWPDARSRKVFSDEANWRAEEPLLHTGELRPDAVGVWCGESDPFLSADRKLVKAVSPAVSRFSPGGHQDEYWRGILPDVLKFVGQRLN